MAVNSLAICSLWNCCLDSSSGHHHSSYARKTISYSSALRSPSLAPQFHEEVMQLRHKKKLTEVKEQFSKENRQLHSMEMIDLFQRLGIDYHFDEEIEIATKSLYENFVSGGSGFTRLSDISLMFRLLREARYPVSSDLFHRFLDKKREFNILLSKDTKGMLRLYEASYLNTGEELLYKANEFSNKQLKCSITWLDQEVASEVQDALEHPYHISLQRHKVHQYLHKQRVNTMNTTIQDLARMDFTLVQIMHQKELQEVIRWWRSTGFAEELELARDQSLKWYTWSMTCFTHPRFSKYRVDLTKIISFVYLIDDIFDVYGSVDELCLFTDAINKWELSASATESLPTYMRHCYMELHKITNEIAETVTKKHRWNPIYYLKNSWIALCNAFLLEAKWFANKQVPKAKEYIKNGTISSGVHVLLVHAFFLLEQVITQDAVDLLVTNPIQTSSPATMLRLWDDLGSAEDENQKGHDGSYLQCYMKENPNCSRQEATEHAMSMISKCWEQLNQGCFSPSPFSHEFTRSCLNMARMVKVMYTYSRQQELPLFEELVQSLLFQSICRD